MTHPKELGTNDALIKLNIVRDNKSCS